MKDYSHPALLLYSFVKCLDTLGEKLYLLVSLKNCTGFLGQVEVGMLGNLLQGLIGEPWVLASVRFRLGIRSGIGRRIGLRVGLRIRLRIRVRIRIRLC